MRLVNGVLVAALISFSLVSHSRAYVWQTEHGLWVDAWQNAPRKPRPALHVGRTYGWKGDVVAARHAYEAAIAFSLDPRRSDQDRQFIIAAAHTNLAQLLLLTDRPAAIRTLETVIASQPTFAASYYMLAFALCQHNDRDGSNLRARQARILDRSLPEVSCVQRPS